MQLSGWGRYPRTETRLHGPRDLSALRALLGQGPLIARGLGRAYGDSAAGAQTVSMVRFNRFQAFDAERGLLVAEAGVSLAEIIAAFLPLGWFPAVTPGTKFVTLGGAIAADVHGKNHHCDGSFGAFVEWFDLMGPDGSLRRCSRTENTDLFHWTLGGMGLTGIILRVALRLRRVETAWMQQRVLAVTDLDHLLGAFEAHAGWHYSVAWIDCLATGPALGRGLLTLGAHARPEMLPASLRAAPLDLPPRRAPGLPFDLPGSALNRLTLRAFNAAYYARGRARAGETLLDIDRFFYPLDAIAHWNRLYGRRGFIQYQCVLPLASAAAGLRALLTAISQAGTGSFLAVLKRFGVQESTVSFPQEGHTLALDFPRNARSFALMPELDRITLAHGGRLYLAKDARLHPETLRRTDPRWQAFARMRRETGLSEAFASAQSERLGL